MSETTYQELTVLASPETEEAIGDFLFGAGALGLETADLPDGRPGVVIRASYSGTTALAPIAAGLRQFQANLADLGFPILGGAIEVRELPLEDWGRSWKEHFKPLPVGKRLIIAPPWEDGPFPPGRQLLRIDPGMAFGTGHHATTRMCLESAERFLEEWPAHAAPIVLDLGTGTGILAIAAASLGAEKVFALDTDPEACDAARKNLAGHALATRVQIIPGSLEALDAGLRFDLILSNLDTKTLRPLFSALRARLSRDGCIMATGITTEDEEGILEAVRAAGLAIIDRRAQEGWLCLILRNKA